MLTLKAEKRDIFGRRLAASRAAGLVPIIMYGGPKEKSVSLFVSAVDFQKVYREAGESSIVSIASYDGTKEALIHDIARDPVSGEIIHADLYIVERGKPIEVTVPLVFVGIAPAVKSLGGILVKVIQEIDIEVLPKDIPHEIAVDISKLEGLDSQILVSDLSLPASARSCIDANEVVATIATQRVEKEEMAAGPDFSQIEVEKKGKREEVGEMAD